MTTMRHHLLYCSFVRRLFFLTLALLHLLSTSPAFAQKEAAAPPEAVIDINIDPNAKTVIFNRVVLLPLLKFDNRQDTSLTSIFHEALNKTEKYTLLSPDAGITWFNENVNTEKPFSLNDTILQAGRSLQARGVITGRVTRIRGGRAKNTEGELSPPFLFIRIDMTDAQTGQKVWSIRQQLKAPPGPGLFEQFTTEQRIQIAERAIQELIAAMVKQGDIFSTRLPHPTVLSHHGEIRTARIVVQPDPPHLFAAYQLLRAEHPDLPFRPVSIPVLNDKAALILQDTQLKDGVTYWYTVIGLTPAGLANVPVQPFAVTTTGAPRQVEQFYAADKGLRHSQLSWTPSQDSSVNGYTIYRSKSRGGPFAKIATVQGREQQNFIDYGKSLGRGSYGTLEDDTTYYYLIRSRNVVGLESIDSAIVTATTKGAPLPPTSVQAISGQPRQVPLTWMASVDPDTKGYTLFRSEQENGPFTKIDYIQGREQQQYTDKGRWGEPLADDTTYFYRIQAVNVVDLQSSDVSTVSARTKPAPVTVTGIVASQKLFRSVQLTWKNNPEADIVTYEVFRSTIEDSAGDKVGSVPGTERTFTDGGLEDGHIYWYRIRAVDRDELAGSLSPAVSSWTKPVPSKPAGVTIKIMESGLHISWTANPEKDIAHYEIISGGFLAKQIASVKEPFFLHNIGLEAGKEYRFQVRAVDLNGLKSPYSEPVTVTVLPQTTAK